MIKLYQNEWHGIKFKSFAKCNDRKIATKEFYDKFYEKFFQKFNRFDELDNNWVQYKLSIADVLIKEIKTKKNVLSIGCGISIVEKHLAENIENISLTALEPSENVSKWIEDIPEVNLKDGYFPEVLQENKKFDLTFANSIDYAFNNKEYEHFLKSVVDYGIKEFVLISASSYQGSTIKSSVKEIVKSILSIIGLYDRGQFWGYQRTAKEQIKMLKKSGFKSVSILQEKGATLIIKASI